VDRYWAWPEGPAWEELEEEKPGQSGQRESSKGPQGKPDQRSHRSGGSICTASRPAGGGGVKVGARGGDRNELGGAGPGMDQTGNPLTNGPEQKPPCPFPYLIRTQLDSGSR
jgi:hypothetical protein